MPDLPSGFWSGWIIVLAVTGFAGLAWLVVSVYLQPHSPDHDQNEPVWDGTLREGSSPAPMWWFWFILAAMIFSVVYLMLYPGLGAYAGALKWSQGGQFAEHQLHFSSEFAAVRASLLQQTTSELARNPQAMDAAETLFSANCSACHGADARGQASTFPNLRDVDWQWGGTPEQIEQTIRNGRTAVMIPWQTVLGEQGVLDVPRFVQTMAAGGDVQGHAGQAQYMQLCIACHGPAGDGNLLLGAPRLNDAIWLYGGGDETVVHSIGLGRSGQMPAFAARLDDLEIKLLVAWLGAE
jgi:cytochrome c oxidase cbb3-type subunit III